MQGAIDWMYLLKILVLILKPNPQCDGVRKQDFGEVIKFWWWNSYELD